ISSLRQLHYGALRRRLMQEPSTPSAQLPSGTMKPPPANFSEGISLFRPILRSGANVDFQYEL
ncbi:hypothetical protein, partial [Roseovarius sp. ZX-A-9]|uniref:hypothetical protein n=1 Tax=Roseovarius sp. ZX-A-9 TaxID=3014783 RepID=UPI00232EB08E